MGGILEASESWLGVLQASYSRLGVPQASGEWCRY